MKNLKNSLTILFTFLISIKLLCQDIYVTKASEIHFFAGTIMEDIDAINTKSTSFLNTKTGEVSILIPNNQFQFKRSLMQEHFNENYMETEKYPKSSFKARFMADSCDFNIEKKCVVSTKGTLNIHGVTKETLIKTSLEKSNDLITATAVFEIILADFDIDRPKILLAKLADRVKVNIKIIYEPYKK